MLPPSGLFVAMDFMVWHSQVIARPKMRALAGSNLSVVAALGNL
jgi:hypothetical protein